MNKEIRKMVENSYKLSKKLNHENDAVFTDIVCYLRSSSIGEMQVEETIQEILDMFLRAQARGDSIDSVIGKDYKAFCDSIIASSENRLFSLQKLFILINSLIYAALGLLSVNYIFQTLAVKSILLYYDITAGYLMKVSLYTIGAYIIVQYIGENSFELRKKSKLHNFLIGTLLASILFIPSVVASTFKLEGIILFTVKIHYLLLFIAGFHACFNLAAKHLNNKKYR